MKKPELIHSTDIDLTDLENLCQEYIDFIASDEFHEDNDYAHYIFEKVLETFFGNGVWDYVNSKL